MGFLKHAASVGAEGGVIAKAPGASQWLACRCCGKSFPAQNLVSFSKHPGEAICVRCTEWLYGRSRPIARRLSPFWQMPPRIRAWLGRTR